MIYQSMIYHSSASFYGMPGKKSSMGSFATEFSCRGARAARPLSVHDGVPDNDDIADTLGAWPAPDAS